MTGQVPDYLSSNFISRGNISGRTTRSSSQLNIPLFITKSGQRSFYYRTVTLWNALKPSQRRSALKVFFARYHVTREGLSVKLLSFVCQTKPWKNVQSLINRMFCTSAKINCKLKTLYINLLFTAHYLVARVTQTSFISKINYLFEHACLIYQEATQLKRKLLLKKIFWKIAPQKHRKLLRNS